MNQDADDPPAKVKLDYERAQAQPGPSTFTRVVSWVMIGAGVPIAISGLFQSNPAARINIVTTGAGLVFWGVVVRFQHFDILRGWRK